MGKAMTRARLVRTALALLPAMALCACVAEAERYPSLARRPAERIGGSVEAVPTDAAPAPQLGEGPSAAISTRISQLLDAARTAQRDFAAKRPAAERAVAGSSTFGTEAWATASTGLAQLESAHGGAVGALAQLDQMEVDQRIAADGVVTPDIAAIVTARNEVAAIVDAQSEVLAGLRSRVAS
jgi:hypothetical protein